MARAYESERQMHKRGKKLCWAGWSLFGISLAMPAFVGWQEWLSGWGCMVIVFQTIWESVMGRDALPLYYAGFAVANAAMLASPFFVWRKKTDRRWMRRGGLAMALATAYVLSWFAMCAWYGDLKQVGIGYYAWLLSFGLVTAGALHLGVRRPKEASADFQPPAVRSAEEKQAMRELEAYLAGEELPQARQRQEQRIDTRAVSPA